MKQLTNGISGRLLLSLAILVCPIGAAWADLVTLSLPFTGVTSTYAIGVNDSGEIVGVYSDASGTHGFVDKGGVFTSINVPGASSTVADGINAAGVISGIYTNSSGSAVFLDSGGTFSYPSSPGGAGSAFINNNGLIAGTVGGAAGYVINSGIISFIHDPGFTSTQILGLNNSGQLAGFGFTSAYSGFVDTAGVFAPINDPLAGPLGTSAQGINDLGQVAGAFFSGSTYFGFIDTGGVFTTVDFPGSVNTQLFGINDSGEAVGDYTDSSGVVHAFVDSPAPEPSYSVLLVSGAAGVALARRRRKAKADAARARSNGAR
jgi:hypothetical protein